jgi:hypothetical protein
MRAAGGVRKAAESEGPARPGGGQASSPALHHTAHLHPDLPNVSWCMRVKQFLSLLYCRMTMRPESDPQMT